MKELGSSAGLDLDSRSVSEKQKKLLPFGDKLVLEELSEEDVRKVTGDLVQVIGRDVYARVVAVGPGLPYGRGEYYEPLATEGMIVIVPHKVWEEGHRFTYGKRMLRAVHERYCVAGVVDV